MRFASFREFYPHYLREHANRTSRRLHVAGTGPSFDACKALAHADDRIRLYGPVGNELRHALIGNADCMVVPSLRPDNNPVSIQDAFQSGPVVIASRIGGIPEMVRRSQRPARRTIRRVRYCGRRPATALIARTDRETPCLGGRDRSAL